MAAWGTEMPLQDLRGYTVMDRTVAAGSGNPPPPPPPRRDEKKEVAFAMAMGLLSGRERQKMRGASTQSV
jgi:hypothetical protein